MDTPHRAVVVLSRALDQAGDALAEVRADDLEKPTPCAGWTVRHLAAHLSRSPANFLALGRGEDVDWAAAPEGDPHTWVDSFRSAADDLLHHWHQQGDERARMADWQSAELAVHTWDLVRGLGRPVTLDPEVAERGLAFLQENLTDDNRGDAFGRPVEVGADAPPYDRLAAFAGRDPRA